jgi:hypothetical protein
MGLLYDYHELLTIGFVKVTRGYVKKAEPIIALPFISLFFVCLMFFPNLLAPASFTSTRIFTFRLWNTTTNATTSR